MITVQNLVRHYIWFALSAFSALSLTCSEKLFSASDPVVDPQIAQIYYSSTTMMVRKEPRKDAQSIGKLFKGDSLKVMTVEGDVLKLENVSARWVKFDFFGRLAYVYAGFLQKEMPLLTHSQAKWAELEKINAKYNADFQLEIQRIEKAERAEAKRLGEEYQNCAVPCEFLKINPWPAEYRAGCTQRKLTYLGQLMQKNSWELDEVLEKYGDGYCLRWYADWTEKQQDLREQCWRLAAFPHDDAGLVQFPLATR